ncbi:hypothetical protein HYALB_00010432 [Hymenoscyphus albidus]|uniref:Hcy-binding domain-containing protein n=1 Tax=Hymenoscyphus albidus TaxID=595503 RepID=A0A9N9LJ74_9HELO|nr:hypothetical protein HYALB_00010432 [Hymenoscyphus albidus]
MSTNPPTPKPKPKTTPRLTLLDGGLGTTLTSPPYNIPFTSAHPLWSSHLLLTPSSRETLRDAQKTFVDAGVDVLLSATYQASFVGFSLTEVIEGDGDGDENKDGDEGRGKGKEGKGGGRGIGREEAGRLMRGGVRIARECFVGRDKERDGEKGSGNVALSLGAYGATTIPGTEYSGLYDDLHTTVSQLAGWHFERLSVYFPSTTDSEKDVEEEEDEQVGKEKEECWENVNWIAFETLPTRNEILAVRRVMDSLPVIPQKPFWISCVFPGEENILPDDSSCFQVVEAMLGTSSKAGEKEERGRVPDGIGINCTKVSKLESLVLEFEDATREVLGREGREEWPILVVYPDGTKGEAYNTTTKMWEMGESVGECLGPWDEIVFGIVMRARERGLWREIFVGGCCKSTAEDIGKLRRRIDEL